MLQCHVKNCNTNNFPLRFEDAQVELIEADFNPEFLSNMLNKLDWEALTSTAVQVNQRIRIFERYKLRYL
jgi:multifunctional methyltransferase subunit TRM112